MRLKLRMASMESQTAGSTGDHPSHHMRWLCPDLPSLVHMVSAVSAIIRPAHTTYAQARVELIECRSWQPASYGTGGILADDYRTIQWFKINALSGGTSYMPTGLGLRPWYLKGFNPVQPITSVAPAPIAAAPEGALPPAAEAPAGRAPSLMKPLILSPVSLPCPLPWWSIQGTSDKIHQAAHRHCDCARGQAATCHRGARRSLPFPGNALSTLLPLSMPCLLPW